MSKKQIDFLNKTVFYFKNGELKSSVVSSKYMGELYNYYILENGYKCFPSQLFLTKMGAINDFIKRLSISLAKNEKEIIYLQKLNISILEIIEQVKNLKEV